MNFFRNLNIAARLSWLQILLVAGLGLIAVAFLLVNVLQSNLGKQLNRLDKFALEAGHAKSGLLELRRNEKDFLLRMDKKYVERHQANYETLAATFATLGLLAETPENKELVKYAAQYAAIYKQAFETTANTQVELGLSQDSGLHGDMRKAVHDIEERLKTIDDLRFDRSMLMMRRHEKDFIQREDPKYIQQLNSEYITFTQILKSSSITGAGRDAVATLADTYQNTFNIFAAGTQKLNTIVEQLRDAAHKTEPFFEDMVLSAEQQQVVATQAAAVQEKVLGAIFFILLIGTAGITTVALYRVSRTISGSLARLGNTVSELSEGDYSARTRMEEQHEIGEFARTFDTLLDERVATLAKAEQENEKLNNSIIDLMETVSLLSDKDLTVRVKVAEDVTGPVADSLNLMAEQTAKVLREIQKIANDVESAAESVQNQGGLVTNVAGEERVVVMNTMAKLEDAVKTMTNIAKVAQSCNNIAARASTSTQAALKSVADTEHGMNDIRETISETEKRIKRLAERSQEITGIVEIINNISERTHVLALNASMQAAAAGDAGRGFAVVADEVQRLAESSRQSTSEISTLVKNIQAETAEAMATMNSTIGQVVSGTELARKSAEQMLATQKTAEELSLAVAQIAKHSTTQAKSSSDLLFEASKIVESTEKTGSELFNQSEQTAHLVAYSKRLLESVQVFRLA